MNLLQLKGPTFPSIRPYIPVYPIAYRIAYDIAVVLLNLFRQPYALSYGSKHFGSAGSLNRSRRATAIMPEPCTNPDR